MRFLSVGLLLIGGCTLLDVFAPPVAENSRYGTIVTPVEGSVVHGETIYAEGRGFGIFENQFILELQDADGNYINSVFVFVDDPNFSGDGPWTAEVETFGYTGEATLKAYTSDPRDGHEIVIASVSLTIEP